jgi:ribonuclease HI
MNPNKKAKKYYAYLLPAESKQGITENWPDCQKIVSGKEARYRGFESEKEAEEWIEKGASYEIKLVKKLEKGIYFDSGTGRNQKVEISVTDEKGNNLLNKIHPKIKINKFGKHPVPGATNNYGELLACKHALNIAIEENSKKIFGDSRLVLDYWSKGFIKKKELPLKTVKLAAETAKLRKEFERGRGSIKFIEGGNNPADLGFHR